MRSIILTTGTSLLTNRDGSSPWSPWRRVQPLPDQETVTAWLRRANPRDASAESATLQALDALEASGPIRVRLVHSDTSDGAFCAMCLHAWLSTRRDVGDRIHLHAISGLGMKGGASFETGLRDLVQVLGRCARTDQDAGSTVEIAATGGFKAEAAVAGLVGALLGVPVRYLHQEHGTFATIPPLPIVLDPTFLSGPGRREIIASLAREPDGTADASLTHRLRDRIKADPDLAAFIEMTEVDGTPVASLSFLGSLIAMLLPSEASDATFAPSAMTPEQKDRLSTVAHHRPAGWERVVRDLCDLPWVTQVRYDDPAKSRSGPAAAPDNATDILYGYGPRPDTLGLRIATTARNREERDRMIEQIALMLTGR